MVLQKKLDYGFSGYQVPAIPRATRSARKRVPFRKRLEGNQISAFDLLATVAGKLLLDKESAPATNNTWSAEDQYAVETNTVKEERADVNQSLKLETLNQDSYNAEFFASELVPQTSDPNYSSKKSPSLRNGAPIATSDCLERFDAQKLMNGKIKNEMGGLAFNVETGPYGYVCETSGDCIRPVSENEVLLDDALVLDVKPPALVSSDTSINARSYGDHNPLVSFPAKWDDVNVVTRDDEEKSSGCTHPSSPLRNPFRSSLHIGDRRIRKILALKYWKVGPRSKNVRYSNYDENLKSGYLSRRAYKRLRSRRNYPFKKRKLFYCSSESNSDGRTSSEGLHIGDRRIRKILALKYWKVGPRSKNVRYSNYDENLKSGYLSRRAYKRLRSRRNYPFKKRKLFYCSSESNSDGRTSSEGISDSPAKSNNGNNSILYSKMNGVTGESSSLADQHKSFNSRDSHVKLRIKSFRVPELFIEIPESATVGSLKRTVMEAVTEILGDGLCVGVLLQGKKVRDDNKTLLQTGISCDNLMDALGFSLEPNPSHTTPLLCPGGSPLKLPRGSPLPLARYPANPGLVNQVTCDLSPEPRMPNRGNFIESNNDCASSLIDMFDKSSTESKALVDVPAMSMETLAVVPAHKKSKQSDVAQRRIRRPFSISEVEALVQAVEKLGTGRWRDVKLRAFDNAKHRTYVDLKDKWKTLLHTARISPQQRRGKPVPQELLDRVLNAHTYWSQQQQPSLESCLLSRNSTMIASSRCDVDEKILG
ncbi:TRF-like 2 [Hibiscus trionum]|uniref:TRF-like 2 n=1 Tax=Hibiscus trionum TaxID=183268 RepID=A0A9W7IB10_HIBTR|nr:TRF-like 2 [Hibiscus trionum]